jgi:hypothetical protein
MARTAAFAGPSRGLYTEANADVCVFPPASSGDLAKAARDGFSTIILADTLFLDASPTHQELVAVLEADIRLFGCASSGALRAVELESLGMIGHGCVYEIFKQGHLSDDGELATVLDANYQALVPPLIEIRYFIGSLVEKGMPHEIASEVIEELAAIYFMKRTLASIETAVARRYAPSGTLKDTRTISDPAFRLKERDLTSCIEFTCRPTPRRTGTQLKVNVTDGLLFLYNDSRVTP